MTSGLAFEALGLVHRVRVPAGTGPHPILVMVYGLQGDEAVTWIFARTAGPEWLIVTPRAPYPASSGYTWNRLGTQAADSGSYADGLVRLTQFVEGLAAVYPVDRSRLVMLGFSQGAAMSYAFAAGHPTAGIAALCGFIPGLKLEQLTAFKGLPVIILHGTQDDRVPITVARTDRDQLRAARADVTYLEEDTGHKVGTQGMHALRSWLAARLEAHAASR